MQFSNLLPCIVALITPALAQAPLTTWARVFNENDFAGYGLDVGPNDLNRCFTLTGDVYRDVKSIRTFKSTTTFPPWIVRCKLYSDDECDESSYIETVATTHVLHETDVAAVLCNVEIGNKA